MINFKSYGIETPQDLMIFFKNNMKYGFVYRNKVYTDLEPDFQKNMDKFYKLRLGDDFIKNKYGVCWDFSELEREFLASANIEHKCYFIESFVNREEGGPTHTFALYKNKDKWFWFEYAWQYYRGIHEYNSLNEALKDIVEKFELFYDRKVFNVRVYEIGKFKKRVNTYEFVEQCIQSGPLNL